MGSYRFVLALCVAFSHIGFANWPYNIGVASVISFYTVSGYVIMALIRNHYSAPERYLLFLFDRALRLYPQYLLYLALGVLVAQVLNPVAPEYLDVSAWKIFLNALMVPLNFYMIDFGGLLTCAIMPWSLGLEVLFYLVIPFILYYELTGIVFAGSVCVFVAAYLGIINTDLWGYRFLPGTIFIFLLGAYLEMHKGNRARFPVGAITLMSLVGMLVVLNIPQLDVNFNLEVLAGIVVAIAFVPGLARRPSGRVDTLLGGLSYGVFLNHPILIQMFRSLPGLDYNLTAKVGVLATSISLALVSYRFVEMPVMRLRRGFRNTHAPAMKKSDSIYLSIY